MKPLTLAYLMVASAAALHGAKALDFCNSGVIQTNVVVDTASPGSSDKIVDCKVGDMVAVTYSTENTPSSRVAPAALRVVGSTFGEDARLILIGKAAYAPEIANTTACNILVQGNTFRSGAMLYIRGVFAPDSTITVTKNTFDFGFPLANYFPDPPGATESFSSAIYVHDFGLLSNAGLSIASNTITGHHNNTKGFVAINAINFGGDLYLYGDRAHVDVVSNDIDITCNATSSFGMAVGGEKQLYLYGADARFAVDGNRIRSTGSSAVFRHPDTIAVGSGRTSFSNNIVTADTRGMAAPESGYRPVVRLGILNLGDHNVNTWVSNNTIDVTGPLASIGVEGDLACGQGCALYMVDNRVTAAGGSPAVQFTQLVELRGNGAMWISGNNLTRSDAAADASCVTFGKSLRLTDASAASVDNNVFNAKSPALMVELSAAAQGAFVRQTNAQLNMCGNRFGGAEIKSLTDVKAVTSTQIGNAATAGDCPATTTTTVATTTSASTAAPESEGNVTTPADNTTAAANATTTAIPGATTTSFNSKGSAASLMAALAATVAAIAAAVI